MKLLPLSVALVLALAACNKSADTTTASADVATATVAAAADATVAQAPADAGSIDTYDLTMDNVHAMMKAQVALAAAEKADPTLDSAMNISEENDAQYVARLESTPKVRAAIEAAGMSVRDYAYTAQSLVGTMMAVGAVEAGQLKEIPEGVNPRNVEFVKAHRAELEKMMQGG
jgi:hypothetical protein